MKTLLASLLGVSLLAGCAVAPYDYSYGGSYYYDAPAYGYYDYGPTYYYGPGYYGGVVAGPPVVIGNFRQRSGDRHRWSSGSWQRGSVGSTTGSRSSSVASANQRNGRNAGIHRGSASRQPGPSREREPRRIAGRNMPPNDHGS